MPTWLFEILFWGFMIGLIVWPILWRAVAITAAVNVYDAVTRKPEAPHVETIEEAAARNIKARATALREEA